MECVSFNKCSTAMNKYPDQFDSAQVSRRIENEGSEFLNERRLKNILSQVQAGIAHTDVHGQFIEVNERYCSLVGWLYEGRVALNEYGRHHASRRSTGKSHSS